MQTPIFSRVPYQPSREPGWRRPVWVAFSGARGVRTGWLVGDGRPDSRLRSQCTRKHCGEEDSLADIFGQAPMRRGLKPGGSALFGRWAESCVRRASGGPAGEGGRVAVASVEPAQGLFAGLAAHVGAGCSASRRRRGAWAAEQFAAQLVVELHAGHASRFAVRVAGDGRADRRRNAAGGASRSA